MDLIDSRTYTSILNASEATEHKHIELGGKRYGSDRDKLKDALLSFCFSFYLLMAPQSNPSESPSSDPKDSPKDSLEALSEELTEELPDSVQQALKRLNNEEKRTQANEAMAAGQALFERGRYKKAIAQFKTALALSNPIGRRGGEIQMWLVNAYIAAGDEEAGKALCRKLIRHPDVDTKQVSKRMLYILEAPELEIKPEWVTKIPDLANMDDDTKIRYAQRPKKKRKRKAKPEPEPIDLSQVNTADNQFVWIALVGILLTLGGLFWFS